MNSDQTLSECIEKMGVWLNKHPSGALIVTHAGERIEIYPHEDSWTYKIYENSYILPTKTGVYLKTDIQKFVHKIQKWAWRHGAGR